jgi:hypothetical protein
MQIGQYRRILRTTGEEDAIDGGTDLMRAFGKWKVRHQKSGIMPGGNCRRTFDASSISSIKRSLSHLEQQQ